MNVSSLWSLLHREFVKYRLLESTRASLVVGDGLNGAVVMLVLGGLDVAEHEEREGDEYTSEETNGVGAPVGSEALVLEAGHARLTHEHVPLAAGESGEHCGSDDHPNHQTGVAVQ